jgi:hypothetical protein
LLLVVVAALVSGAGMGLLSPALTVVVQNSVPVARMGSATTITHAPALAPANASPVRTCAPSMSRPPCSFIRQVGAALGVSAFVLAATAGGFRVGLLLTIAVSAEHSRVSSRCLRTACMTQIRWARRKKENYPSLAALLAQAFPRHRAHPRRPNRERRQEKLYVTYV